MNGMYVQSPWGDNIFCWFLLFFFKAQRNKFGRNFLKKKMGHWRSKLFFCWKNYLKTLWKKKTNENSTLRERPCWRGPITWPGCRCPLNDKRGREWFCWINLKTKKKSKILFFKLKKKLEKLKLGGKNNAKYSN
jgi:hypothetical protein